MELMLLPIFKKARDRAGIDKDVSVHSLRHSNPFIRIRI